LLIIIIVINHKRRPPWLKLRTYDMVTKNRKKNYCGWFTITSFHGENMKDQYYFVMKELRVPKNLIFDQSCFGFD